MKVDDQVGAAFDLVPGGKPVPVMADISGGLRLHISFTGEEFYNPVVVIAGSV